MKRHLFGAGAILSIKMAAVAVAFSALTACAPSKVEPLQSYQGAALPRPEIIIVNDFIATPDAVKLDIGLGARLRNVVGGTSEAEKQSEDDRKVTRAISRVLVDEIRKLGFAAMQSNDGAASPDVNNRIVVRTGGTKLIVVGQVLSIDEGNRTRRNVIGLGAGQSEVRARADAYYYRDEAGLRLVESFAAEAESSRKPGAAETMGAGAATGRVVESAAMTAGTGAMLGGDVEADGERLAKAIAKQLAQFFAKQGWIAAASR
jgi:hypothetical protein